MQVSIVEKKTYFDRLSILQIFAIQPESTKRATVSEQASTAIRELISAGWVLETEPACFTEQVLRQYAGFWTTKTMTSDSKESKSLAELPGFLQFETRRCRPQNQATHKTTTITEGFPRWILVLGDGCGKRMNCTNRRSF
jgi:hypothetical protein